jgi:hypothetical protein
MSTKTKLYIFGSALLIVIVLGVYFYFKYFFTYEQKNITQRKIETITGQNLTITVFGYDGKIIKRWYGVQKLQHLRIVETILTSILGMESTFRFPDRSGILLKRSNRA